MIHDQIFWILIAIFIANLLMTISIHMGLHVLYNRIKGPPEEERAETRQAVRRG